MLSDGILNELLAGIADPSFGRRFELDEEAGRGGMGVVYHATEGATGNAVAIKVMSGGDRRDHERFSREAEVLESLNHPNIVRYLEHGVNGKGDAYLVMEWLEGETLSALLKRGSTFSWLEITEIGRQVVSALRAAHELGVVHRDIKPSNVFLEDSRSKRVVLLDFGVARRSEVSETTLTSTGEIVGTPGYMAPEQVEGRDIDERTDLFALGVVLYELTCRQRAFPGEALIPVLMATLAQEPTPVSEVRPATPGRLAALIDALIAKKPGRRPSSASVVAHELELLRDALVNKDRKALAASSFAISATAATRPGRPDNQAPLPEASGGLAAKRDRSADSAGSTATPHRRGAAPILAVLAAAMIAAGAIAFAMLGRDAPRSLGEMLAAEGPRCDRDSHQGCSLRCTAGDQNACATLGEAFATGLRRPPDIERARGYLVGACDAGVGRACYRLARLGQEDGDEELLRRACDLEVPAGCRALAAAKAKRGDFIGALTFSELGCDLGDVIACRRAAESHLEGRGVPVSTTKARAFLSRACAQGYQWACEQLD